MKNFLVLFSLSFFYFLSCFFKDEAPAFFLAGVPLIIGIGGYQLIDGEPFLKRTFAALIPIFALIWTFFFLDINKFVGVALMHSMLIGLIIVQVWEFFESGFRFMYKRYKNK